MRVPKKNHEDDEDPLNMGNFLGRGIMAGDRLGELFVMGELFGDGCSHNNSGQSQPIFCEVFAFSGGGGGAVGHFVGLNGTMSEFWAKIEGGTMRIHSIFQDRVSKADL
jgi:hypothetical protein